MKTQGHHTATQFNITLEIEMNLLFAQLLNDDEQLIELVDAEYRGFRSDSSEVTY